MYADNVFGRINDNFTEVKSAIDGLESQGTPSGGGTAAKYRNNPFPAWKEDVRILSISNSYGLNPTCYINEILDTVQGAKAKVNVTVVNDAGWSLQQWADKIASDGSISGTQVRGGLSMGSASSINAMLAKPWDIVILQQNSDNADDYTTHEPHLSAIVSAIRQHCTNQRVCIAWQMVWGKNLRSSSGTHKWDNIAAVTQKVMAVNGIDVVVPTGTAIENARLAFGNSMMKDTSGHLSYGIARYVGAMTWIHTLMAPMLGINIVGMAATHAIGGTYDGVAEDASNQNAQAVTDDNKERCQKCALAACNDMWNITTIS